MLVCVEIGEENIAFRSEHDGRPHVGLVAARPETPGLPPKIRLTSNTNIPNYLISGTYRPFMRIQDNPYTAARICAPPRLNKIHSQMANAKFPTPGILHEGQAMKPRQAYDTKGIVYPRMLRYVPLGLLVSYKQVLA